MKNKRKILAWVAAGLVALAAVGWRLVELPDASARLAPLAAVSGQTLEPLPLAEWEKTFFGAASVRRLLARGDGPAVVVTVVDGSRNRRAVHDPAFCFRGAGWTVADDAPLALPHGEARRVTLKREDGGVLEAVYWFSDGRRAHGSPARYWLGTTWRRMTLGRSGPEPVLVLLVPAREGAIDWARWLSRWPQFTRL